jgi:hypothetical protein
VTAAGCTSHFEAGEDSTTTPMAEDRTRELAERFAPTLFFDENERWFPTDPRRFERERDGEAIVDGFDALDGYTERFAESGTPPAPTVFYNGVEYAESPLAVIQFWYYSAFDQFTTNFHWHDWEVLHVFVDTDSGDPQLYVASSHSGRVPNNEFLDPDPEQIPRVLSELGSHSSALSINDVPDRFQRLPLDGDIADITNSAIEGIEDLVDVPLAYGLPRDEGSRLPYLVPELDGAPVYDHAALPNVRREDLLPEGLTVGSFSDLASPPRDLPERETGLVFEHAGRQRDADVEYDLVPATEVEHIADFTGPQLSFEFAVPGFAEDAIAGHITTTGVPWAQERYRNPAANVSDPNHRGALADRYEAIGAPAPVNTIVASVTEAVSSEEAPEDGGVTTQALAVESVALIESEPAAVPTTGGVVAAQGLPEGEHRLTVNGAGLAPHSETVAVSDEASGPTAAGVEGELPLVARENATKLAVDAANAEDELTDLAVEDDFAGRLYDAPLDGRDAVYVHRGGAYTTEVRDSDDAIGAYRVNPAAKSRVSIDEPATGKEPLAHYLADVASETAADVAAVGGREAGETDDGETDGDETDAGGSGGSGPDSGGPDRGGGGAGGGTPGGSDGGGQSNAVQGLTRALEAVAEAARRAAERAAAGDRGRADQQLQTVQERLARVQQRLAAASGDLPDDLERAIGRRVDQSNRRSEQARASDKL